MSLIVIHCFQEDQGYNECQINVVKQMTFALTL